MGGSLEVGAICDLDEGLLARASLIMPGAATYTDVERLLKETRPDVVVLCTPPRTHALLAVQALESGASVLIEKPMALSGEECDQILEAHRL